jgi:hypothetical protein
MDMEKENKKKKEETYIAEKPVSSTHLVPSRTSSRNKNKVTHVTEKTFDSGDHEPSRRKTHENKHTPSEEELPVSGFHHGLKRGKKEDKDTPKNEKSNVSGSSHVPKRKRILNQNNTANEVAPTSRCTDGQASLNVEPVNLQPEQTLSTRTESAKLSNFDQNKCHHSSFRSVSEKEASQIQQAYESLAEISEKYGNYLMDLTYDTMWDRSTRQKILEVAATLDKIWRSAMLSRDFAEEHLSLY